jgi:antitoxin component YwqK of YwqJK toxin-antitoxin module|tara:strand:- start:2409 stop:2738 length:330 start_codon:yes stop_codon:yes gene_type:complete
MGLFEWIVLGQIVLLLYASNHITKQLGFIYEKLNEQTPKVSIEDLVERNGLKYIKFTDVPITGKVEGKDEDGFFVKKSYKDGELNGPYEYYDDEGQLGSKRTYRNGKLV